MSGQPDEQGGSACRHGNREGRCSACAACAACDGGCGVCPYAATATPSAPTGDHGGLREAVEALVDRWERENRRPTSAADQVQAGIWSATKADIAELRALLAAHPEPEPAQDGEVGAVLAELILEHAPQLGAGGNLWNAKCLGCDWRDGNRGDINFAARAHAQHLTAVLVDAGVVVQ